MFGRAYQWLIMGTYSDQWWTKHDEMRPGCNDSDVASSLEAAILTGKSQIPDLVDFKVTYTYQFDKKV